MATAPSFADLERLSEPFEENGKQYILVKTKSGTTRRVRWYEEPIKKIRPTKDVLGFSKGYIYLVKGDTYNFKDWLRESEAVYRTCWGWAFPSDVELPQLPAGLSVVKLLWEKVAYVEEDELRTQSAIDEAVAEIMYDPSPSKWQGEIGDRIERLLTVTKVTGLPDGYYGPSTFFLFSDEAGNEYCWTTAAKKLELNETYEIRGTIKSLQKYKGKEQTVLTRCRVG
jgi:hypothetical protein